MPVSVFNELYNPVAKITDSIVKDNVLHGLTNKQERSAIFREEPSDFVIPFQGPSPESF